MENFRFSYPVWTIQQETGYEPKTTFWDDFSIADVYGTAGVKDTFNRAFREWKKNTTFLTELVLVLNWKIWQHYESNKQLALLYNELYSKADEYAYTHLKGDDLKYYYKTTD